MKIELYLSDSHDAFLFNKDTPEGISVDIPPISFRKSFGTTEAITILISSAATIPTSLIVKWLYNKFTNCESRKISINRRTININDGEITKIIEESINIEN